MASPFGRAVSVSIGVLLGTFAPLVGATTPCMWPEYEVAFASPVWSVHILRVPFPGTPFWYQDPRNGTYEDLYNHSTPSVGEDEPVTLFDRDGDRSVSANDSVLIWDPEGTYRILRFWLSPNPGRGWMWMIELRDGWRYECRGVSGDSFGDVLCVGTISLTFFGLVLMWAMWKKHRKRRRMPF